MPSARRKKLLPPAGGGQSSLVIGLPARAAIIGNALFPSLTGEVMKLVNRLLPKPVGVEGDESKSGREAQSEQWRPAWLTRLSDAAIGRQNEADPPRCERSAFSLVWSCRVRSRSCSSGFAGMSPVFAGSTADQVHLTLAFLGSVASEAEEKLRANLGAIQFTSFFLPLRGLGRLSGDRPAEGDLDRRGAGHPHLFQLHQRVTDAALAAGIEADLGSWRPHITLARCEKVSAESITPFLRAQADFDAGLVPIDSFQLKSSLLTPSGSIYTTELLVPSAH